MLSIRSIRLKVTAAPLPPLSVVVLQIGHRTLAQSQGLMSMDREMSPLTELFTTTPDPGKLGSGTTKITVE